MERILDTPHSLRPSRFDSEGHDQLIDIQDLQAALPGIRRLRHWAHEALDARPGESAVDIGCGTGSEVFTFATAVGPTGTAAGVEPDPQLLAVAERRAAHLELPARFVGGDAYNVPFGAETFDVALCERVFQHLTMPGRAAAEIERVLKPGGRTVVMDADWGTAIVHPGDRGITRKVIDTLISTTTDPYSGRHLPGLLTRAGLEIDEVGSHALVQSRDVGPGALVARIAGLAVARGVITDAQRVELLADLESAAHTGDIHISVTMFAVYAHKPAR